MRILSASHSFYPEATGVGNVATALVRQWVAEGHVVSVVTGSRPPLAEHYEWVKTTRFNCAGNQVKGLRGEIDAYRAYVVRQDVDVMVLHCAQAWCLDALLTIADRLPFPLVVISHGLSAYRSDEYANYFTDLAAFFRRTGATLVALSSRLEEPAFCAKYGLAPPQVIPNGVHLEEWQQPTLDVRTRWQIGARPWVLTVSNHSTVKNHAGFWKILGGLKHRVSNVRGTIIGRSYVADRRWAQVLRVKGGCWYPCCIRAWGHACVDLKTNAARADVVSAIQEADLLLITSHREAAPLVALEAMAAATPWISLRLGAVGDFTGGEVVDSLEEMERAATRILVSPDTAATLGQRGRIAAQTHYAWHAIARQHIQLYRRLIENERQNTQ